VRFCVIDFGGVFVEGQNTQQVGKSIIRIILNPYGTESKRLVFMAADTWHSCFRKVPCFIFVA
tara:strand:+ start:395 stop:583 length:189 start_codon:yes stop_codon:yes gene_type:complete